MFPFRDWEDERGLLARPGWSSLCDPSRTFTSALRRAGWWTGYVTDNPHIVHARAFRNFRRSFDRYRRIAGQAGHAPRPVSTCGR
jgi:hypothetical protein